MSQLSLRNLNKSYATFTAVRGINLEVQSNEFVALVGPSGCGKSTTLRMIAGLEEISGGEIWIGDRLVNDVSPGGRDIAMVFQNYALYPHMTVYDNIAFGLRQKGVRRAQIDQRVSEVARILELSPLLKRKPRMLSGGQRQRVAMGRAIIRNPKVFLFDEPLSNLDAKLRTQMRTEIKRLHQIVPTTTVYVTHDQVEAMTMADRIVVMNGGVIEQVGTPHELYNNPKTKFVAGFIGSPSMNFLDGRLQRTGAGLAVLLDDGTSLAIPDARVQAYASHVDRPVTIGIRPENVTEPRNRPDAIAYEARVELVEPLGVETLIYFSIAGTLLCSRIDPLFAPKPGETMSVSFDMGRMHLIDKDTGSVIHAS